MPVVIPREFENDLSTTYYLQAAVEFFFEFMGIKATKGQVNNHDQVDVYEMRPGDEEAVSKVRQQVNDGPVNERDTRFKRILQSFNEERYLITLRVMQREDGSTIHVVFISDRVNVPHGLYQNFGDKDYAMEKYAPRNETV